jgi:hypothetical protein
MPVYVWVARIQARDLQGLFQNRLTFNVIPFLKISVECEEFISFVDCNWGNKT